MKISRDQALTKFKKNPIEAEKAFHIKVDRLGKVFDEIERKPYPSITDWIDRKLERQELYYENRR